MDTFQDDELDSTKVELMYDFAVDGQVVKTKKHRLVAVEDLLDHIQANPHCHEVILGPCKLYLDIDHAFGDEDEFECADEYMDECIQKVKQVLVEEFGEERVEDEVNLKLVKCNRYKKSKGKYVASLHIIVNGLGYRRSGADWLPIVNKIKELVPDLDNTCYKKLGKQQGFRCPFASKLDEPEHKMTPFRMIGDSAVPIQKRNFTRKDGESIEHYFATLIESEELDPFEAYSDQDDGEEFKDLEPFTGDVQKQFDHLQLMISAMKPERAESELGWKKGLWAIRRLATRYNAVEQFRALAHQFAKLCPAKYDREATDIVYSVEPRRQGVGYGYLRSCADEDTPNWLAQADIPISYFDNEDKMLLLARANVSIGDVEEYMLGCLAFIENTERWFVRFRSGWQVLPGNSKQPFPYSTLSAATYIKVPGPQVKDKEGKLIDGRPVKISFKDILTELKLKPIFKRCCFSSEQFLPYFKVPPKNIFNTFGGWMHKFTEEKIADDEPHVKRANEHLLDLCGGEVKIQTYVLNWLAQLIQNPCKKSTVLAFFAKEGNGKNLWLDFLKHAVNPEYVKALQTTRTMLGTFNTSIEGKLLTVINEAKQDGESFMESDLFKTLATEVDVEINQKFEKVRDSKNYNKYIIFTNNKYCLKVGDGRRFLLIRCSNEHIGDEAHFAELAKTLHNSEAGFQYFNWLAQRDISDFKSSVLPETALKTDLKIDQMGSSLHHVRAVCENRRRNLVQCDADGKVDAYFTPKELYADYREFCAEEGTNPRYVMQQKRYKDDLIELLGLDCRQRKADDGSRPICFHFVYSELDRAFQKHLRITMSIFEREEVEPEAD